MSARRATRSARVKPHKVRGRELEEVREKDPDGRIVYHHRTVDTLGKMLRAGTITQAMHDAAKDFQAAFIIANLDPLRSPLLHRIPGNGRPADLSSTQLDARRRVHEALDASVASAARQAVACGTWSAASAASVSGRSVWVGADGPWIRSKRKGSWWRRLGCSRATTATPSQGQGFCILSLDKRDHNM